MRSGEAHALSGYVLLLDDITLEQEEQARLDRRMLELTEASRASVASVQAALDMLDYPDLEPAEREGFQGIVRAEVTAMSARLDRLAGEAAADGRARWPLQEMRGADLLAAAARKAGSTSRGALRDALESTESHDGLVRRYRRPFGPNDHEGLDREQLFLARFDTEGNLRAIPG